MATERENTPQIEAQRLLEGFVKAGAKSFDLTITTLHEAKVRYIRNLSYARLNRMMPDLLKQSAVLKHNIIVRPRTTQGVEHVQLDDLTAEAVERVKPAAFLCLQTSPGNYQAWVAVHDAGDAPDFARRLRKGAGADPTASGATRIAGSLNFKKKYAPRFPRVEITHLAPGRIASKDELEQFGLVAPKEEFYWRHRVSVLRPGGRKWPDYQRCVEKAPPNHGNTGPDISRADFVWCMTAIDWGWGIDDTATRLMAESSKARENGEKYALLTAQHAAAAVERRRAQLTTR